MGPHLQLSRHPNHERELGEVRRLDGEPDEWELDPPSCVVDVRAKQQGEHERGDGQHKQHVGQFAEVLEVDAVNPKHHNPSPCQQSNLLEQEFGAVAIGFVGQRADRAVHGDQRGHSQHEGNAPKHAVAFQPLTDAGKEFVHRNGPNQS